MTGMLAMAGGSRMNDIINRYYSKSIVKCFRWENYLFPLLPLSVVVFCFSSAPIVSRSSLVLCHPPGWCILCHYFDICAAIRFNLNEKYHVQTLNLSLLAIILSSEGLRVVKWRDCLLCYAVLYFPFLNWKGFPSQVLYCYSGFWTKLLSSYCLCKLVGWVGLFSVLCSVCTSIQGYVSSISVVKY